MRRLVPVDDPGAGDPWWADQLDACVSHYWAWRGRRWLLDVAVPALPAVARMERAREMCLRRHGVDPLAVGPPPGHDSEGRPLEAERTAMRERDRLANAVREV